MRITLLCTSAEAGRDGVGDYVSQFARALGTRGHACQIVALADRYVGQPTVAAGPQGVELVRLPASDWERNNIGLALERVAAFGADWLSLQMVCYGFEERGLLWRSAGRFAQLRAAPRRHMMFHELWIGSWRTSPLKERAAGWLQRRLLLRATRAWSPSVVHTSNALYREMLARAGITAEELALPGNIPVCGTDNSAAREQILQRLRPATAAAGVPLLAGVFGTIHPEWSDGAWLETVAAIGATLGRRLVIVQVGRPGAAGLQVLQGLRARTATTVEFLQLGELPAAEVSAVLQGLDFGVATTPWPLIGKSGTAAAMLEHGLPVLVTRESETPRMGAAPFPAARPQVFRLGEFCDALRRGALTRFKPQSRSDIYDTFMCALEQAS